MAHGRRTEPWPGDSLHLKWLILPIVLVTVRPVVPPRPRLPAPMRVALRCGTPVSVCAARRAERRDAASRPALLGCGRGPAIRRCRWRRAPARFARALLRCDLPTARTPRHPVARRWLRDPPGMPIWDRADSLLDHPQLLPARTPPLRRGTSGVIPASQPGQPQYRRRIAGHYVAHRSVSGSQGRTVAARSAASASTWCGRGGDSLWMTLDRRRADPRDQQPEPRSPNMGPTPTRAAPIGSPSPRFRGRRS
jgi:hypothetical protein